MDEMRHLLVEAFQPEEIEIIDESHRHAGHKEARKSGGGHFQLHIVSKAFEGQSKLDRHRSINAVLSELYCSPTMSAVAER